MFTKEQYLTAFEKDIVVIRHLASKLSDADMDYRPTEGQRSVRELLGYLSYIFLGCAEGMMGDMAAFARLSEEAVGLTLANFDERMEAQTRKFREIVTAMTDTQLAEVVDMWVKQTRAEHLVNGPLKFAAAYKTQLFTYMKQNGHSNLNTMNLWAGMDAPSA